MKLNELFPGKWLKASDLQGQPQLVTIERVKMEAVEEGQPAKPVLVLRGLTQGLVLNKTNAATIASFLGDDLDRWPGNKIVIFPTQAPFQGKMTDCIRARQPKQQAVTAPTAPQPANKAAEAPKSVDNTDDVPF